MSLALQRKVAVLEERIKKLEEAIESMKKAEPKKRGRNA